MRQIVLDTETTGLNPRTGDRVIEIGCVEIKNRMLTGNNYHRYINPERDSHEEALAGGEQEEQYPELAEYLKSQL